MSWKLDGVSDDRLSVLGAPARSVAHALGVGFLADATGFFHVDSRLWHI
jgi:hypothetical protein